MRRLLIATAILLWSPASARAQGVTVNIEPGPGADFAAQLGLDLDELEDQLRTEIEDIFHSIDANSYLRAISDAQAFSTKGLGVDYASNPTFLSIGGAANATVSFGNDGFNEPQNDQPIVGLSANVSIMAGLNLGRVNPELRDLIVYANFFSRTAQLDDFNATLSNAGVHAQYKVLRPKPSARHIVVQWGGIDLTGGLEWSRLKLRLSRALPTDIPVGDENDGGDVRFTANGRFDIDSATFTMPAEASTNVRFFGLISAFGGVGIDLQAGTNDMDVQLDGTLVGTNPDTQSEQEIGTATVQVSDSAGPNKGKLRFFAGLQLNAWRIKAFIQLNVAPDRALGATFGSRLAW